MDLTTISTEVSVSFLISAFTLLLFTALSGQAARKSAQAAGSRGERFGFSLSAMSASIPDAAGSPTGDPNAPVTLSEDPTPEKEPNAGEQTDGEIGTVIASVPVDAPHWTPPGG